MTHFAVPKTADKQAVVVSNLDVRLRVPAYGKVQTVTAVSNQVIHPLILGADLLILPAAGVQMTFASNNAADTVGGTGINTLHIHYLDANLDRQHEEISLSGVANVTSNATNIRAMQCMHIGTAGSGKKAAGTITAIHSGTTYSVIPAGQVRCTSSVRRVPAGFTLMIESVFASASSIANKAEAFVEVATTGVDTHDYTEAGILIPHLGIALIDAPESITLSTPFPVGEGQIVALQVTTTDDTFVTGGYIGYLKANPV